MGMAKHRHQSWNQPAWNDANLLDETFFNPEEQLILFLQQTPRGHRPRGPAMPPLIPLLLLDGLLKHGLQPTISVTCGHSCSCRITQRSPPTGRGYEVDLAVEGPLLPLLSHAITHDEPRHVAVSPLMDVIGPALEHGGACDLHVEDLQPLVEARHLADEVLQTTPRTL